MPNKNEKENATGGSSPAAPKNELAKIERRLTR